MIDTISREERWRMKYSSLEKSDVGLPNAASLLLGIGTFPTAFVHLCVHGQRRVCEESNQKHRIAFHVWKGYNAAIPGQKTRSEEGLREVGLVSLEKRRLKETLLFSTTA